MTAEVNDIDRQAADWVARTERADLPAEEQAAFEAWLAADERHLGAVVRIKAALIRVERLRTAAVPPASHPAPPIRRRTMLFGSIAASLLAVAVGGGLLWTLLQKDEYATQLGETKAVTLPDGSVITLNTESRAAVHYTQDSRKIALLNGEVLFDVAKNKTRPFIVKTRGLEVRAVGTSFSVLSVSGRPVEVLVREGTVKIENGRGMSALAQRNEHAVILPDGTIVTQMLASTNVTRHLIWMTGHIYLQPQTLASAAAEFARYSRMRIVVDPAVANRMVTGVYRSNDPAGFARAVAVSLNIDVRMEGDKVRLTPKTPPPDQ